MIYICMYVFVVLKHTFYTLQSVVQVCPTNVLLLVAGSFGLDSVLLTEGGILDPC